MRTVAKPSPISTQNITATGQNAWHTPRAQILSLFGLALLCAPLFFFRLGAWALFDADEGRYAEIPRAMIASGDWVTPMLNGVKFFDKPPLLYWLGALSFQIFGVNEFAARFPPALAATAAVFGAYALGRKMFGPRAGLLSAAIGATTLAWPILGRVVLTDMLVSSLVFLSLALWWIGRCQTNAGARLGAFFGFWTALGLGVLAKGPVALVLTFGTIGTFCLLSGERSTLRQMGWKSGILWAITVAAPWFVVVQGRNPEYNHAFWFEQNFQRFMGGLPQLDHANGPHYFFVLIPVLFLPWTFFAPHALKVGWRRIFPGKGEMRSEPARAILFLGCGVAFTTLFFSASPGKLVTYILPVVPLLAVALGGYFEWQLKRGDICRGPRRAALAIAVFGFLLGIAGLILGPTALLKAQASSGNSAIWVGLTILFCAATLAYCALKLGLRAIIAATALGFTLIFAVGTSVILAIAPTLTTPSLLETIRPGLAQGGEIVSIGFTQSLSFYTGERIAMVDSPDELRSGISHLAPAEKKHWFLASEADLKRYFGRTTPVYLVLRSSREKSEIKRQKIDALGGDFEPVARNARFTILGNVAARRITPAIEK